MSHAAEEVLSTVELLVAILAEVDMHTLLTSANRVSRHWHGVTSSSVRLQRALFFQPERETEAVEPGFIRHKTQNPLLRDVFPAWFENIGSFTPRPRPGVNPMHYFPATAMMGYKRFQELPLYRASLRSDDNPFLRPGASWRRMLTSQPPCYSVSTNAKRGPGASVSKSTGRGGLAHHDDGLRMGELYDTTLRHSARYHVSGFMVIWLGGGGGDDDDDDGGGYADLARHLRRMSGILPVRSDLSLRLLWAQLPDLVVQMLWTEGRPRPGDVEGDDLGKFWERCGAKLVSLDDGDG